MNTSIKKLPMRPSRLVKKYITDMKVTDARQAMSRVWPIRAGAKPSSAWSAPTITTACSSATG